MTIIFDWRVFCSRYGIEYVLHGPNVAAGNINIRCPFCDDPSHHLGLNISPKRPFWGCWRCKTAGRHPYHLLLHLFKDSRSANAAIAEQQEGGVPDAFESLFSHREDETTVARIRTEKPLPSAFRRLAGYVGRKPPLFSERYLEYLERERHFPNGRTAAMTGDLHYAITGDYAGRLILPIYASGKLISWVGRKISDSGPSPRYKTEDSGDLKRCIANMDALEMEQRPKEKALLVGEGPMDYLKLEVLLGDRNCVATCTFGVSWTDSQLVLLSRYAKKFGHTFIVYDKEARMEGMKLVSALREVSGSSRITATFVPGRKDPGEMRQSDVPLFVKMLNAMLG